jgi:hypothetical protein
MILMVKAQVMGQDCLCRYLLMERQLVLEHKALKLRQVQQESCSHFALRTHFAFRFITREFVLKNKT